MWWKTVYRGEVFADDAPADPSANDSYRRSTVRQQDLRADTKDDLIITMSLGTKQRYSRSSSTCGCLVSLS